MKNKLQMSTTTQNKFLGHKVLKTERKLQGYFMTMLRSSKDPKEKSILRDILLYEEMNEWLLRSMYNI